MWRCAWILKCGRNDNQPRTRPNLEKGMHEGCQMLCTMRLPYEAKLDKSVNLVGPSKCAKRKVCDCQAPYTFHAIHIHYWIWVDCTISSSYKEFHSFMWFHKKTYGLNFSLKQMYKCVQKILLKTYSYFEK